MIPERKSRTACGEAYNNAATRRSMAIPIVSPLSVGNGSDNGLQSTRRGFARRPGPHPVLCHRLAKETERKEQQAKDRHVDHERELISRTAFTRHTSRIRSSKA